MAFEPRSWQQIVAEMAATLSAETPINDYTPNSVALTLLEAAAQEDFQQYIQMIEVVRNYNLDTTEGEELDRRAFEFGLVRIGAKPHSGFVTITDSRFTKIQTKLYAGLPGPIAGTTILYTDDASSFPSSGSVYVGRGTDNSEGPIAYSAAPVDNTSFWTITLDTALVNDHGTDETVILAQFGQRVVEAGTEVRIPENDFSEEVLFELNQTITILDGENTIENVLVTALEPGATTVPRNSIREFVSEPFTGASVANPSPLTNGRNEETDQELRDRIRDTIQSLSRGTPVAIRNSILGITDPSTNSSITSANVIPPVVLADGPTKVFIDNGRGIEPNIASFGLETLTSAATGGEKLFQLSSFPLAKANIISQKVGPFNLSGGETLILKVGITEETFIFNANDFRVSGTAQASEVAEAINNRATTFEARTITNETGERVFITPVASSNENIKLNPASTANSEFNFSTDDIFTLKLYKNDKLLAKDGLTASVSSLAQPFDLSTNETTSADDINIASESRIVTKLAGVQSFVELVNPGDYIRSSDDTDAFYTKVRTVVDDSKLILEDPYPLGSAVSGTTKLVVWSSPQLEVAANGDLDETEVVSFSKNDFSAAGAVLASEALTRIQSEVNLSRSELVVNNTQVKFTSYLENSENSKMRVVGGHAALAMGFTTTFSVTGTVDVATNSKTVSGTSTLFTSELKEGQWIKVSADGNGSWSKIESIENDTTLYLVDTYRGNTASGVAALGMNFGTENVGSNKDYTLNRSNGQIELEVPLVAGESLTAGSVNTRAFVESNAGPFNFDSLGVSSTLIVRIDGGQASIVNTGDASAPFDTFRATELENYEANTFVGFHAECTSGNNFGETDFVASYTPATGEVSLVTGLTASINIGDRFVLSQVLSFTHATDFADSENVSSEELTNVINTKLKGATAQNRSTGKVRIRSNNFESGSIKIVGGTANAILGFSTTEELNQETNVASLQSGNSDRQGLSDALGFTLAPSQNLVVTFDDDNANKTFNPTMRIEGEVSSGAVNSVVVSSFANQYSDDFFNDFWVYWKAGATNEATLQIVTDYDDSTGTITTQDYYPTSPASSAPAAGDFVQLVPRTVENLVKLLKDLNTTTMSINSDIEAIGNTGDFLQLSTKIPGTGGNVLVSGGTANNLGIAIQGINTGAGTGKDESQTLNFDNTPDDGVFKLSFDGEETALLYHTATNTDIQTALNNLSNLSDVVVTGSFPSFAVQFGSSSGNANQPEIQYVSTTFAGQNDIQLITFSSVPDSGQIRLEISGNSFIIEDSDSAADVKAAIEGTAAVTTANVTGDFTSGFQIEITSPGNTDFPLIVSPNNPKVPEIQSLTFSAVPTSGNIQYEWNGFLTNSLAWNTLTAALIEAELETASGESFTVTGNTSTGFTVTFDSYEGDAPEITINATTLDSTPSVSTTQTGVVADNTLKTGVTAVTPTISSVQDGAAAEIALNDSGTPTNMSVVSDDGFVSSTVLTNSIAGLSKGMPVKVETNLPSTDTLYISNIQGTTAPYSVTLTTKAGDLFDVINFTLDNEAVIQAVNSLNFPTTQVEGVDGYKFKTGLVQLAQWTIDGLDSDLSNYPGFGAAGTQFEVLEPKLTKLNLVVNVTPVDGVSLSSISNQVSSAVQSYVNSLDVGEDVIISEIVAAVQNVTGVFDVEVTSHSSNIVISDGEQARLDDEDLIIG